MVWIGGTGRDVMAWLIRPVVGIPGVFKGAWVVPVVAIACLGGAGHPDIWIGASESAAAGVGVLDLNSPRCIASTCQADGGRVNREGVAGLSREGGVG